MANRCSDTKLSKSGVAWLAFGLAAALLARGARAEGDAVRPVRAGPIRVTERAALNGRFGLEIRVGGQTGEPSGSAFVAVGPEKGLSNETALEAGFTIDVSRLSLRLGRKASGVLPFLRLGQPAGPASVVVFLEEDPSGSWFVGARTWDDASGTFILAGRAPLPLAPPPGSSPVPPRLELEWTAFSPQAGSAAGSVRMLHASPDGARVLLFERTDLDNGSQVVNAVGVGILAGDRGPAMSGHLFLDDFEVNRLSPSLP